MCDAYRVAGGVRGGVPEASVRALIGEARRLIQAVPLAADVPQIRKQLIEILKASIEQANAIALKASETANPGEGGISAKAQWMRLASQMTQVLDGVLKNVQLNELNERLERVEKELDSGTSGDRAQG